MNRYDRAGIDAIKKEVGLKFINGRSVKKEAVLLVSLIVFTSAEQFTKQQAKAIAFIKRKPTGRQSH